TGLIFANSGQHLTERRMYDPVNDDEADHENAEYGVVHGQWLRQIKQTEKCAARNALQAVLAASERQLVGKEVDNLCQRQSDHGEINATAPDGQFAEDCAQDERAQGAGENACQWRKAPYFDHMAGDIGSAAEKGRV